MKDKQAFYAKTKVEIMSTNSLKKTPKTKIWIPAVISTLILVVLLGCYRKIIDNGNPYFVGQTEQNNTLSGKDLKQFASFVKVIDGQAESHYKVALHFQRRKKHKLAIEELKRAVHLNPLFAKAYNAMGISYDNLRRYNQAIRCYQSALKLDPKLDYAYNNLGYSYLLKNKLDEAIVAFEKAIELKDSNKRYHNNLGLAYVMKDQYDKAYEQFKIVEDETKAEEKLTRLLYQLGKEKPDQYLSKDANSGTARVKTERKTPVVIRRKIKNNEPQPLIMANISAQKPKDEKITYEQYRPSDKKAFLNTDQDKDLLDETETSTGYSRPALEKNPQTANFKKIESLGGIEKQSYHELQTESNQSGQIAPCEFCAEDNTESDNAAIGANHIQTIGAENQKSSNLSKKPAAKAKEAFIKTDRTVSEEKQLSVYAAVAPNIISTDKKLDRKIYQRARSQQEEALSLATKEANLKENPQSDGIIVEIEIANGNGINGAAALFGSYLKSKGIKVANVTNANSFDHVTTKIFYCNEDIKNVYELLHKIPLVPDQKSIIELKNMRSRIKIIIGKDLVKHDKIISRAIYQKRKS